MIFSFRVFCLSLALQFLRGVLFKSQENGINYNILSVIPVLYVVPSSVAHSRLSRQKWGKCGTDGCVAN
jgi:hypothetical protein